MNATEFYNRGLDKARIEAYGEAIRDFNEAARINTNNTDLYYHRGFAHYKLGEYQAAIDDFSQVLQEGASEPLFMNEGLALLTYLHRGIAYSRLKRYPEALADFFQILSIDFRYAPAYYNRGFVQLEIGNQREALEDFQTAAQLFKEQENILAFQEVQNVIDTLP
jgi:tetratricopeptide (TPR) repeat protein